MAGGLNEVFSQLIQRAKVDREFRNACLKEPEQAFWNHSQLTLPREARVWFILALEAIDPSALDAPAEDEVGAELADKDLEGVAGGAGKPADPLSQADWDKIKAQVEAYRRSQDPLDPE
jgi:hypothetical protein